MNSLANLCAILVVLFSVAASWPAIVKNFRNKDSGGFSLAFVTMWVVGNTFNLLGAFLVPVNQTQFLLRVYYFVTDATLFTQVLLFGRTISNASKQIAVAVVVVGFAYTVYARNEYFGTPLADPVSMNLYWLASALFNVARLPQLYSCVFDPIDKSFSPALFAFTIGANAALIASIYFADDYEFYSNVPAFVGAAASILLDAAIVYVWIARNRSSTNKRTPTSAQQKKKK